MNYPQWSELAPTERAQSVDTWGFYDAARALGCLAPPPENEYTRPRRHVRNTGRSYLSRYVGVTKRNDRWMTQWGPRGNTTVKYFGMTPEDELRAAWHRARVLGLSEPEVRQ